MCPRYLCHIQRRGILVPGVFRACPVRLALCNPLLQRLGASGGLWQTHSSLVRMWQGCAKRWYGRNG